MLMPEAEAGFRPLDRNMGFTALAGPYYRREGGTGEYGFRADERHRNPHGVLHGGSITTFVDTVIGQEIMSVTGRRCATVTLNHQFMAGGHAGDWIAAKVTVRKVTRSMAFADAEVTANGEVIGAATAVFRLFAPAEAGPGPAASPAG